MRFSRFCVPVFMILLSACGFKPIVGPSDPISSADGFAYILVGIETEEEYGFTKDWEMGWVRVGDDVVGTGLMDWGPHDWLRTTDVNPIAGDEFDGVMYFLRKMTPGDFELQEMYHSEGPDYAFTKPRSSSLRFSVPGGQISNIGTFRLARNSDGCLVPVEHRMDSAKARSYLDRFTAVTVPVVDVPLKDSVKDADLGCELQDGSYFFIIIPG